MYKISTASHRHPKTVRSKLHGINTGAIKAGRPRFDKQINMGVKHQFKRGFEKGAAVSVGGVIGWSIAKYSGPVLKAAGRGAICLATNPARVPGPYLATMAAIDMAAPGFATRVERRMQNARGRDHARKMRAKTGQGSLSQKMLDFDVVEYMRGDYSNGPKSSGKVRSVQGELNASKNKTEKQPSKKSPVKRTPAKAEKRAGRTFKRTRIVNGKRINETVKNYRYGK